MYIFYFYNYILLDFPLKILSVLSIVGSGAADGLLARKVT